MKSKLLLAFLSIFFSCSQSKPLYAPINPNALSKLKESVVRLVVYRDLNDIKPSGYGTGYFVDQHGTLATAYHVLNPDRRFKHLKTPGWYYATGYIHNGDSLQFKISQAYDEINILRLMHEDFVLLVPVDSTFQNESYLEISERDTVNLGEQILTGGFPFSEKVFGASKGFVYDISTHTNQLSFPGDPMIEFNGYSYKANIDAVKGMSGAPVISLSEGKVIGTYVSSLNPSAKALKNYYDHFDKERKSLMVDTTNIAPILKEATLSGIRATYGFSNIVPTRFYWEVERSR